MSVTVLLRADHHFAIRQQLVELGVNAANIDVIYNPVKRNDSDRPAALKFLYIGRVHFDRQKQLKDLFDALRTLEIIGDGEDLARC